MLRRQIDHMWAVYHSAGTLQATAAAAADNSASHGDNLLIAREFILSLSLIIERCWIVTLMQLLVWNLDLEK